MTSSVSQVVFRVSQSEVSMEDLNEPISIYLPQSESSLGEFTDTTLSSNQTSFLEFNTTDGNVSVMIEMRLDASEGNRCLSRY